MLKPTRDTRGITAYTNSRKNDAQYCIGKQDMIKVLKKTNPLPAPHGVETTLPT